MKKTNQKRYLPEAKQVKISAFFSTLEKPTDMHGKRLKSQKVTCIEGSENRGPDTVKDTLNLKCQSSKSEVDINGKCNETRSHLQVSKNFVSESNPLSENNKYICNSSENVLGNQTRNADIRRMKRKLIFVEGNNVERKDKFLKFKHDQMKELRLKHVNISSASVGKCSKDKALVSDECKHISNKCFNRQDSDTSDADAHEINTMDMKCATSDTQTANSHVSDKIEFTLDTCEKRNVLDLNYAKNNIQLDLIENTSITCGADFGQDGYIKNNLNGEHITSHVTETETKGYISETFGSWMLRNGLTLDTPVHCNIMSIEHLGEEVLLNVQACYSDVSFKCFLRGVWVNIKINVGDHVLMTATSSATEPTHWTVDNDSGSIILYPDFLISGTSIVNSLFCMRRSVLGSMFRGLDVDSQGMVIGALLHQIFQQVLKRQVKLVEEIEKIVTEILLHSDSLFSLYASKMSVDETKKELAAFVPRIHSFVHKYLYPERSSDSSEVRNPNVWEGEITSVADIEENIWVPKLGLKGKVDVTVKTKTDSKEKLMPLELKTGRASFSAEHCGQVILYIMMMNELGYSVESGLLLYLREGVMKEINIGRSEYRDLIVLRNEYVYYLLTSQRIFYGDDGGRIISPLLPEPINHHSACTKCPYLTVCSSALIDNGLDQLPENNLLRSLSKKATGHLKKEHIDYVFHWTGLLQIEHNEMQHIGSKMSDIWFLSASEREKNGSCLANLTQLGRVVEISAGHYEHTFFSINMSRCTFVEGDYLIVSTDTRAAVAAGTVICICNNYITLDLERDLSGRSEDNWHLDKYISNSLHIFNISNLGFLLENTDQAARLRQAIISLEVPKFAPKLSSKILKLGSDLLKPLNIGQKSAIFKAFAADHYVLFKGMPGTGKTATVVCLILLAVRLGFSILITSHTHSAIDNILLRLKGKVDFIRLGSARKIHCDLMQYSEEKHNCLSPTELQKFFSSKPVAAVTCFGCGHPLLQQRQFDICIVDEATQVLQPTVLRALFSAKKFILVGDPDQMPPLVKSIEASKLGLADSLFVRLDRPAVTAVLTEQYRMNETITFLANRLTYNGRLKCANDSVSKATLQITKQLHYHSWLNTVLSSEIEDSVVVLDTGVSDSALCISEKEVDVVLKILTACRQGGITDSQIGIIAPYRAQVLLLRNAQKDADFCVEVNTVDQYQGRDKDIVLYSCTQSDKSKVKETGILGDKNRMTVAISRARYKLIIIGSVQTLQCYSIFQKLFHSIPQNKLLSVV